MLGGRRRVPAAAQQTASTKRARLLPFAEGYGFFIKLEYGYILFAAVCVRDDLPPTVANAAFSSLFVKSFFEKPLVLLGMSQQPNGSNFQAVIPAPTSCREPTRGASCLPQRGNSLLVLLLLLLPPPPPFGNFWANPVPVRMRCSCVVLKHGLFMIPMICSVQNLIRRI